MSYSFVKGLQKQADDDSSGILCSFKAKHQR